MLVTNTNDSGAGSLRAAIANAQPGDTIRFDPSLANRTITLTSGEIEIPAGKNLIIDGADAADLTISGNNRSRIFRLASNVSFPTSQTIRNLILANGRSNDRGGAIQTEDLGQLTVENVTFRNNAAVNGGASIWTNGRSGGVTVIDSRFLNNQATAGNDERGTGGIGFIGFGPGGSALVVRGSEFSGNQGINGAAINVINGRVTIEDTRFLNNDTTAARFDTGEPRDFLRGYGGALYIDRVNDSLVIRNSLFQGNRAEGEGGAAYLFADPDDIVTIEKTIFRDNQVAALTGGGNRGNGGAIAHVRNSLNPAGSLTVRDSSFVNNQANHQGGALWVNQTNSNIINSTFSGNRAPNNFGGAITTYDAQMSLTNVTLADNSAEFSGAVARGSSGGLTATNTLFVNNTSNNTGVSFNNNQQTNRTTNDGGGNVQFPAGPEIIPGILIANPELGPLQLIDGMLVRPVLAESLNVGVNYDRTAVPAPPPAEEPQDPPAEDPEITLPPEEPEQPPAEDPEVIPPPEEPKQPPAENPEIIPPPEEPEQPPAENPEVTPPPEETETPAIPEVIPELPQPDPPPTDNLLELGSSFQIDRNSRLQFTLQSYSGERVSEIALFTVDDDQGRIGNLQPDSADYLAAALERAQVVFSALNTRPKSFDPTLFPRTLTVDGGQWLRFLQVDGRSLDALKGGKKFADRVILLAPEDLQPQPLNDGGYRLTWSQGKSHLAFDLQPTGLAAQTSSALQSGAQGELLDLRSTSQNVRINFTIHREASFNNTFGLYRIQDDQGNVLDPLTGNLLSPGEFGYLAAVLANRVEGLALGGENNVATTFTADVTGGTLYAPFLVANGTVEAALADGADAPPVYLPFLAANPGQTDHVRLLADNLFGFEDLPQGGDFDYNDTIVQISFA